MAAPLALPAIISGAGAVLASVSSAFFGAFIFLIQSLFGKILISAVLAYSLMFFFQAELEALTWAFEQIKNLMPESTQTLGYTFQLGSVIDALRIKDCLLVIINAHFAGLVIFGTSKAARALVVSS